MKTTKAEKEEAKAALLRLLNPGQTVYTVLRHVSSSGMSRWIDMYTIVQFPEKTWNKKTDKAELTGHMEAPRLQFLSGYAGTLLDYPRDRKRDGLRVGGCGMDMGFHLVYTLSSVLFRDLKDDPKDGNKRGGGYALCQEWL